MVKMSRRTSRSINIPTTIIAIATSLDSLNYHQESDEVLGLFSKYAQVERKWRTAQEVDLDRFYEMYKESYEKSVGSALSRDWFYSHANGWIFFGDDNGYIAVRQQRSGLFKLAITAGKITSILRAQKDIQATIESKDETLRQGNPPGVWGLTTKKLATMMQKTGYHIMPGWLMKILQSQIRAVIEQVSDTGNFKGIASDGGLLFDFQYNNLSEEQLMDLKTKEDTKILNYNQNADGTYDVNIEMSKYYVADKNYYKWMLANSTIKVPGLIMNQIHKWLNSM